jgi:hypothetical protein
VTPYTSLFVELPEKTNPYPKENENKGFDEKATEGTETGMPVANAVKDETSADTSMSSPLSGQSAQAPVQSTATSSQSKPAPEQSKSSSGGSAASPSSSRNSDQTLSVHSEGADVSAPSEGSSGKAGKEKTPGFEMLLALGGLFGTAILYRKK